ncbi:CBO0543 family protein [Mesobacillus subterraneus]|uniref:Uncharacterized protein n=1 Tax=Mesobacillus subterraneus TaxID=285983 RepID=A0A3R9E9W2_9BACI|nr:CBO0543 family protein [Mesobacillus subterraneus]RSD25425.1 hypothetical protein EJA10_16585 [Mesobacillus subterraneus]
MLFPTAVTIGHYFHDHLHVLSSISLQELLEAERNYHKVLRSYWYEHNFLTGKWWFLVILSIVPAIMWWIIVDKKKLVENTAFGLFYGVMAIFLDSIGSNAMVWTYPVRLTPYLNPQLYPYDVGVVIIPFMLVYQRYSFSLRKFFIATGLLSLFLAFVAEPSMVYLKIYKEITWKHIYSFPIYWGLGLLCWTIIKKFKSYQQK